VAMIAFHALSAQKPTVLHGVVRNLNGVPLPGVELTIANTTLRVVTNDSGEFLFDLPPTGRLRVSARHLGFKPADKGLKLDAGDAKQLDFELEGVPEQLDSVLVLGRGGGGRLAEFWNRRMVGVGAFITRADIERRKPYRTSDLLRTISGVHMTGGSDGLDRPNIQMGRNAPSPVARNGTQALGADCRVNYYLDGMWLSPGTFHLDDIAPSSVEAVEIFRGPSEVPAKFRQRETACGLIVIWTREPPPRSKPDLKSSTTDLDGPRR
jgi:hypothetical protein